MLATARMPSNNAKASRFRNTFSIPHLLQSNPQFALWQREAKCRINEEQPAQTVL
jgi:hypothetical protein